jgi:hypothetical protein
MTGAGTIEKITMEVRHLFQVLKALADSVHKDAGLTASTRAVMESLADRPRTVPDIARSKSVTRQHIQLLVDELGAATEPGASALAADRALPQG